MPISWLTSQTEILLQLKFTLSIRTGGAEVILVVVGVRQGGFRFSKKVLNYQQLLEFSQNGVEKTHSQKLQCVRMRACVRV